MKFYMVTARYQRTENGWTTTLSIPTFFLREDVQMLPTSASAAIQARLLLTEMGIDSARLHGEVIDTDGDGNTGDDYATL